MSDFTVAREGVAPFAGWLDRWCAVRWRAWATWVVLAGVMARACDERNLLPGTAIMLVTHLPVTLTQALPALWYLPLAGLIVTLYQPILLRLGMLRGVCWILLAVVADAFLSSAISDTPMEAFSHNFLRGAAPGLALIGRRTPWMVAVAAVISAWIVIDWDPASVAGVERRTGSPTPRSGILGRGRRPVRVRSPLRHECHREGPAPDAFWPGTAMNKYFASLHGWDILETEHGIVSKKLK
jgi:hypothetical protein